jgi:hypothetical protein
MHDLKFLRQNRERVETGVALKGLTVDLARFYAIEERRLAVLHETEQLKARRNAASEEIAAKKRAGDAAAAEILEMRAVGDRIRTLDAELKTLEEESETLAAWTETLGTRFEFTPASISGRNKLFHSAYHIKVAVLSEETAAGLSDKAFWLSSGNWQSSNQAPLVKPVSQLTFGDVRDYNREWHAIVESPTLAGVFRRHLQQDFLDNRAASGEEAAGPELPLVLVPEALFDADLEAPRAFRHRALARPRF